ncbi:iron-sulfur cluster repair protein YtfE [Teichococcus aestuarii]|uniref:Iron-sulfur cluster repair di-iron protein n=1 Tax=Teichococcus aestuarii TaxID=568898 RepID=A0A2U1V4G6_9PROT|nr:iron-sulfur cluster repair protein YtfE [Pseudoroseomonas aestuarii]PWC28786.1 iron-sulfur cluster repair di-iron protein [Pseudoroseomonas aestuarii]
MSASTASVFGPRSVAEIAAALPGATAVFRRHKLDFCCGGQAPLAEAAARRGVDLATVEGELAALLPDAAAATVPQETGALITLIEQRYHATHRRELPELVRLARRVEAVHGEHPLAPRGLADLLERMAAELEDHMQKEERILFPLMRQGGHPMIGQPISVMRAEHDDHGGHLQALEGLTQSGVPPEGACNTWRALYAGTRKFADDLMEHVHLENNVLFPRFSA